MSVIFLQYSIAYAERYDDWQIMVNIKYSCIAETEFARYFSCLLFLELDKKTRIHTGLWMNNSL
jgi:hypothetical protein